MKNKSWKYQRTNYREKWNEFRKSAGYERCNNALKGAGIGQPFRDNIMKECFANGWWGAGGKIDFVKENEV